MPISQPVNPYLCVTSVNYIKSTLKSTYKHLPPSSWAQGTFWIYPFSAGQGDLKKYQVTSFSFKINYINAWVNNAQTTIKFENCEFNTTNMTGGIHLIRLIRNPAETKVTCVVEG